jgi:transcriptional regulator with XRE-family HTH domain
MDMPEVENDDPVMLRVHEEYARLKEKEGWTLDRLGQAMGCTGATARKAAHQFLGSRVPRIDTLRKFATAVGMSLAELVTETKKPRAKK